MSGSLDKVSIESLELLLNDFMKNELNIVMYSLMPPDEGFEYHWFFNAKTKILERFGKGIQVEIIEDYDEDNYLCYHMGSSIIIQKSKINTRIEH
tara:strand:- start:1470 stop:1754 length:285 start_codon:yes stop_codon:yes gene_type:complete